MHTSEFQTDSAYELCCRTPDLNLIPCGSCQSCLLQSQLSKTLQWFLRAGDASRRHFLIGILLRCQGTTILKDTERLLRLTLGKDFTYTRSRQKPSLMEDTNTWGSNRALDEEFLRDTILETWDWFCCSKQWTKEVYVLRLLPLCNTELLHALGNLTRVLMRRERKDFLHNHINDTEDQTSSIPESHYSFNSAEHPELDLLIRASSSYGQLDDCWDLRTIDVTSETVHDQDPGLQKEPKRDSVGTASGDAESLHSEDLVLTVDTRSSQLLSGVSRYRDFIRGLPVHLAKRILGLLDKEALLSCLYVSQHWRHLTEEVCVDFEFKRILENRAMIVQGSSTSRPNPVYANIREVLVPMGEEEKHLQFTEHTFNLSRERGFMQLYAGVNTKVVEMEERNVYCGAYNLLLLSDRKEPQRAVDYNGGQLVAVGSKDRLVRLLEVDTAKEVPPVMRGHTGNIRAVLLCEERNLVISASYDLSIRCWNLKTGVCMMLFRGHSGTITCLGLHGDNLVSGAKDCKVKVWNLVTGKCYEKLKFQHSDHILCVKMDGNVVLSGCQKGQVKMWRLKTATLIKSFDAHEGSVRCLFLNQWHILSGGVDGCVKAWSTSCQFQKSLVTYRHPKEVLALEFLFLRVITGCVDGKIRIFNFLTGDCLRILKGGRRLSPVLSLHVHHSKIVVNTKSSMVLLQFAEVPWDYCQPLDHMLAGEPPRGLTKSSSSTLWKHPHPYVRAKRMALVGSSNRKIYHRSSQEAEGPALSHHACSLSTVSMHRAHKAQQESLRPATWSELLGYRRSRAYIDLQPEFIAKPPSALAPGRPVCRLSSSAPGSARLMSPGATGLSGKAALTILVLWVHKERIIQDVCDVLSLHPPPASTRHTMTKSVLSSKQEGRRSLDHSISMRDIWEPEPPGNKDLRAKLLSPWEQCSPTVPKHPSSPWLQRPWSLGGVAKVVRRVGAFTTSAVEDGSPPQRMFLKMPTSSLRVPISPADQFAAGEVQVGLDKAGGTTQGVSPFT
ncbi:CMT1A duplicated region transcript 1 protein [Arapaima gigas]